MFLPTLCLIPLLILLLTKLYFHYFSKKNCSEPKGPFAWPLVGNYFQLPSNLYQYVDELSKKYGPVVRLGFGSNNVVFLNRFEIIRDALASTNFASRPDWISMTLQSEFQASFAFRAHGAQWRFLRKNALKALTILKMRASTGIESRCRKALERLIQELTIENQTDGLTTALDPAKALFRCVCTIMGETCFGRRFDPDDPELWSILQSAQDTSRLTKIGSFTDCFPWALVFFGRLIARMRSDSEVFNNYVVDKLERSNEELKDNSNEIYDLTDALRILAAEDVSEDKLQLTAQERKLISHVAVDLFGAGLFTTLTNLEWALLILSLHPEVKARMRREIDTVCGLSDFVSLKDKPDLVYVEATIIELLRFATVLPFGVPHCTIDATQLAGYTLPANTPVLCNLWAAHHDPDTFANPFDFDPDRFLIKSPTPDNDRLELNQSLIARVIPFSTGVRRCPGENLARQNLFLVLTNLVKRLDFDLEGQYGDLNRCESNFSRKPLPYRLRFCNI